MKLRHPVLDKSIGLIGATAVRLWMRTLEYKAAFYDPLVDPVNPAWHGQKIYLFWHEYILVPLALRGHSNLAMLLGKHHDAELLSHAARHLGFEFVRGSTNRGGVAALRECLEKSRRMNLAITPDGPRGPRRVLAQGPIFLASRLQMPLVLMGIGCDRPWRAKSWDRFAIPRPYSRVRGVISPEIRIPPELDRDGIEHYRLEVQRLLNRLCSEAEAWAESGTRKVDQSHIRREPAPIKRKRIDTVHGLPVAHRSVTQNAR